MNTPEEPKFPEPSREVMQWLDEHTSLGTRTLRLPRRTRAALYASRDAPSYVLAWLDACEEWSLAHEVWRAKLPIDSDPMGLEWRFFGGDWLPRHMLVSTVLEATTDNYRYTVSVSDAIMAAYKRMNEDEFRAFIAGVYEHIRARESANVALVMHLRAGEGK